MQNSYRIQGVIVPTAVARDKTGLGIMQLMQSTLRFAGRNDARALSPEAPERAPERDSEPGGRDT